MIPGYDIRTTYARLAQRFRQLAREATSPRKSTKAVPKREAATAPLSDNERRSAKQARAAENARWTAVLASPEAAERIPLACSLLADTDLSADRVREVLAASPVPELRTQGLRLGERMASVPRVDVGSSPSRSLDANTPRGRAMQMVAAYNKATGAN